MEKEIIAAIISAVAVVIAAIIGGIFAWKKKDKSGESTQTALTGGHAFQASGNSHQHVYISETKETIEKPPDQLLITVAEIKEYTNGILVENQQILNPVFTKKPQLNKVRDEMIRLFGIQKARGKFGDWIAFLEHEQENEVNSKVTKEIGELITILKGLHESFYSYVDSPKNKSHIISRLDNGEISISEIQMMATNYLEHLRSAVERIGAINGKLKSIRSKPA